MRPDRKRALIENALAVAVALVILAVLLVARNRLVDAPLERLRESEGPGGLHVYEGSWHFPRGGPYMLGFDSPNGPAELYIDGRLWVRGTGRRIEHEGVKFRRERGRIKPEAARAGERRDFHPGIAAVRFEAPPGARLLWIPPGRRSDPEYVPSSSLSPDPPERASFGYWVGAAPVDAVVSTAILLLVFGLILFLSRRALRRIDRRTAAWFGVVFAIALAIRLFDLGGAGETWDENTNWSAGRNYVTNILSLDFSQASWEWNYQHPPVTKYLAGIGAQWADGYGPARAISALMVAIACALLVPIGKRMFSLRVGVLAGVVAALTPHLIAHGKIVGHEAPAVLLWTLAVWLSLCAHDAKEGETIDTGRLARRFAVIGLVLGLAIWSRFSNGLLAPLIGAILLLQAPRGTRLRTVVLGLTVIPAVAVLVGFAIWPRLWSHPIAHLEQSWDKLKVPHTPEPFLGQITNAPPRYYFAVYLVATAPLGLLVGCAAWLGRGVVRRERSSLVLLAWLAVPQLILLSPVRQDGVRYILPALVALAVAAAAGYDWLARLAEKRVGGVRRGQTFGVVGAVFVAYLAVVSVRVHPYYLDYYGEQYGGPSRVAEEKSFEIAWWGEGLAEALAFLARKAPQDARVFKRCVTPYDHLAWMRADLWAREVTNAKAADWILEYQPSLGRCRIPAGFEKAYEVQVAGAPLARVWRRAP